MRTVKNTEKKGQSARTVWNGFALCLLTLIASAGLLYLTRADKLPTYHSSDSVAKERRTHVVSVDEPKPGTEPSAHPGKTVIKRSEELDDLNRLELPKQVHRFKVLQSKAIRSNSENSELQDLIRDEEALGEAKELLSQLSPTLHPALERRRHMALVDFLSAALMHSDEQGQQNVLKIASDVILADNLKADISLDQRRSLAGDKLELMQIISKVRPDVLVKIVQAGKGSSNEKLLAFGLSEVQRYAQNAQVQNKESKL